MPANRNYIVNNVPDADVPGTFTVYSSRHNYRVRFYGNGNRYNSCTCTAFRCGATAECPHINAVSEYCREAVEPADSILDVDYTAGRRLRLHIGSTEAEAMALTAMRYFDDDMLAVEGMTTQLPEFIRLARRINPTFRCTGDALNLIVDHIDRCQRQADAASLDIADLAPFLPRSCRPAALRAFVAGRCVLTGTFGSQRGLTALAAALALQTRGLVGTVLIVCPSALKLHWQRLILDATGQEALLIEGPAADRRALYSCEALYKIVTYHTLAADVKALGHIDADLLIADQAARLAKWDDAIGKALRRVECDYAFVLAGRPVDDVDQQLPLLRYVDPYASRHDLDAVIALPPRHGADIRILIPLSEQQQTDYDECAATLRRIVRKYEVLGTLSHRDRQRLLSTLTRLRQTCVAPSTPDDKARYGYKALEAAEIIESLRAGGARRIVVVTEWEQVGRTVHDQITDSTFISAAMPRSRRLMLVNRPDVIVASPGAFRDVHIAPADALILLNPISEAALQSLVAPITITLIAANTLEQRLADTATSLPNTDPDPDAYPLTMPDTTLHALLSALESIR